PAEPPRQRDRRRARRVDRGRARGAAAGRELPRPRREPRSRDRPRRAADALPEVPPGGAGAAPPLRRLGSRAHVLPPRGRAPRRHDPRDLTVRRRRGRRLRVRAAAESGLSRGMRRIATAGGWRPRGRAATLRPHARRALPDVPPGDAVGGEPLAPLLLRALPPPRSRGVGGGALPHSGRAGAVRARRARRRRAARARAVAVPIHPTAVVDRRAEIDPTADIGP